MKRYAVGLVLGLSALCAMAQEASNEVKQDSGAPAAAQVEASTAMSSTAPATVQPGAGQLPDGVTTETNPLKQEFLAKSKSKPALFRPSPNMPEIVNEDLLRGMSTSGKAPDKTKMFVGYMPKLKVLPCAKGCEGKDYERAVKEFIKGYQGEGKLFKERGEMIVQVRWFNVRPWLMQNLPYGADLFGVSFILEGKLISLGASSGVGKSVEARELAYDMGSRLGMELAFTLGMGVKPTILSPMANGGVAGAVYATSAAVNAALGEENVTSRIEPATEANANLLPAIDGIKPGEIEPISELHYLNSLLF